MKFYSELAFLFPKKLLKLIMKSFFLLCCTLVFALGSSDGLAQDAEIVISSDQTLNIKQV